VRNGIILDVVDTIPNMGSDEQGKTGDPPNFILQGITYNNELATVVYMHVSPGALVKKGDRVKAGQQIALSGFNGHATGPHLHIAAMTKHRLRPFEYLDSLADNSDAPTDAVASNGICIYPPSRLYRRQAAKGASAGVVNVAELRFGTRASDSVRRLQRRLNGIPLDGGVELPLTGNYLEQTQAEVIRWQVQKRGLEPGSPMADGNVHPKQARFLFGKRFTLVGQ
jgi:murein DD-endopeptidase MepM/ murein hydrolase activator NlpD